MVVSVVMATYNGKQFIKKQLDSIRNQSRQPDEVIIKDDGSTDGTFELVEEYIRKNLLNNWIVEKNRQNLGYKKNFFELLKAAHGDIIFLSDQDDEWAPKKIEKMAEVMEKNTEVKTLNCGISLIDGQSKKVKLDLRKNFYNANFLYSKNPLKDLNYFEFYSIVERNISPGCAMAITSEVKDEFIKIYDFGLPHDWFLNLIASLTNGCVFLNEELLNYRLHGENTLGISDDWSATSKIDSFEKDRKDKIVEYQQLIQAFTIFEGRFPKNKKITLKIKNYLELHLAFYKKAQIRTLLKLYTCSQYLETSTFRGKVWDWLVALKLNKFL
ncbi:MAG: glycosyltransferase [Liquorilactobacillus hordei]|uniref:glycosyltransferase n=1 Tax=Liquorilactobacillus hordei TaxID=468911 RepID=UPI0039E82929